MAVELSRAGIIGEPLLHEARALCFAAPLVEHVRVRMSGMGIARGQPERALDERRAGRPASRLRQRKAVCPEEPPVVAIEMGETIQKAGELLVAILTAAEPDEPVHARGRSEEHTSEL